MAIDRKKLLDFLNAKIIKTEESKKVCEENKYHETLKIETRALRELQEVKAFICVGLADVED